MKAQQSIQRLIAGFLLLMFMVGSLPKSHFHDLVADHTDRASCDQQHTSVVLHNQSVNCHFDDLVVSNPFILFVSPGDVAATAHHEQDLQSYFTSYFYSFVQHQENRGPPSLPAT